MKRFLRGVILVWLFVSGVVVSASAQRYFDGEKLYYRAAYRAKLISNTEVGEVTVETTTDTIADKEHFHVRGNGRTLPFFRWFFDMNDTYHIWVDKESLLTQRFECDIKEDKYTFKSHYDYDWAARRVHTWSQRRQDTPREKSMELTEKSMDALSLYFNLRSVDLQSFREGEEKLLDMVLEDTIRQLRYHYIGPERVKVPRLGRFETMKFACTIGSSEEFSFTDGTQFFIWITNDENKIPVMLSSPVRVGEVRCYLHKYEGLHYPLVSQIK